MFGWIGKFRTFINDKDGLSGKDFLLIVSAGNYFLFNSIAKTMALFGMEVNNTFIALLETEIPLVMAVVAGVMGVQAVESIGARKREKEEDLIEPDYEEPYDNHTYPDENGGNKDEGTY